MRLVKPAMFTNLALVYLLLIYFADTDMNKPNRQQLSSKNVNTTTTSSQIATTSTTTSTSTQTTSLTTATGKIHSTTTSWKTTSSVSKDNATTTTKNTSSIGKTGETKSSPSTNDSTKVKPVPQNPNEGKFTFDQNTIIGIISGGAGLVILLLAIIIAVAVKKRRNKGNAGKESKSINPDLEKLANSSGDHDYAQLAKLAEMFTKKRPQSEKFMKGKFNELEKPDQTSTKYMNTGTVPNCRHPAIACLKSTQASNGLHMNKLMDYFCDTVLIAMAPRVTEFETFWEAILQYNIGVVVWFGIVEDKKSNQENMASYIPMVKFGKRQYGPVKITSVSEQSYETYHEYIVHVENLSDPQFKTRQMYFLHVPSQPNNDISKEAERLEKIADVVKLCQRNATRDGDLRNVLLQCSTGIEESAVFCVIHIGYQMLAERKKVHVIGIIKYVRSQRFGTFSTSKKSQKQIQIIYLTLNRLANSRVSRSSIGGKTILKGETHAQQEGEKDKVSVTKHAKEDEQKADIKEDKEVDKEKTKDVTTRSAKKTKSIKGVKHTYLLISGEK